MNNKSAYIYILTNKTNNVFYIGVTSNLKKRIWEHKNKIVEGFSKKYNLNNKQTKRISPKNAGSSERCYDVGEPLKALH